MAWRPSKQPFKPHCARAEPGGWLAGGAEGARGAAVEAPARGPAEAPATALRLERPKPSLRRTGWHMISFGAFISLFEQIHSN